MNNNSTKALQAPEGNGDDVETVADSLLPTDIAPAEGTNNNQDHPDELNEADQVS